MNDATTKQRRVIRIHRMGNVGNYMIQIMAAYTLKVLTPDAVICAEGLPEWGLFFPDEDDPTLPSVTVYGQNVDVPGAASILRNGEVNRLCIQSYAQHMDNFLPRSFYQDLFDGKHIDAQGFPSSHLVINIRAGEILRAIHRQYTLLPISFYRAIIEQSGLKPVFMGQIGDDPYSDLLRKNFPDAIFQPSLGSLQDFEVLRRSKNIIPAISTFSWLAAWLSDADTIYYPLSGFLNPIQSEDVNLFPRGDRRYRLYLFPINHAIDVGELSKAHDPLDDLWREVTHDMYQALFNSWPRFSPSRQDWLDAFSEKFYLLHNGDIRQAVEAGWMLSGLDHFKSAGLDENRTSFYFDGDWYSRAYPLAALEVAQGDYADLRHHYVGIGRRRGYRSIEHE